MVDAYQRQGPLDFVQIPPEGEGDQGTGNGTVILVDRGFRGQISLRGDVLVSGFADVVEKYIGLRPEEQPKIAKGGEGFPRLLWLGPDEWLLVTTDEMTNETLLKLNGSLKSYHVQVLDISDAKAVIGLTGKDARDLLMKGCPVDLHEREFHSGCSTRTLLGKVEVIIHQVSDRPEYDIYVHRSFSEFLWDWLEDAAQEFASSTFRS